MDIEADIGAFVRWYEHGSLRVRGVRPAPSTVRTTKSHIRCTARLLGADNLRSLTEALADAEVVDALRDDLLETLSIRSVPTRLHALQTLGRYGVAQGWIAGVAISPGHFPKSPPRSAPTFYTADETVAVLKAAAPEGLRWSMFWMTLAGTGRRIHEILDLEWKSIRLDDLHPHLILSKTKTKLGEAVPMPTGIHQNVLTLDNLSEIKRTPFSRRTSRPSAVHPFPWHYQSALNCLKRMCMRSGVEYRGTHELRRTEITRRLALGIPLQAVASLAGHASPRTTLTYYDGNGPMSYWRYVDPETDTEAVG